mmetsp:Transcript_2985/g.4059  ORF Transcript_2985/g.4059 Transcript_2985/m.4059 type:complete len:81 (+) Transcript_2985:218-460(+)
MEKIKEIAQAGRPTTSMAPAAATASDFSSIQISNVGAGGKAGEFAIPTMAKKQTKTKRVVKVNRKMTNGIGRSTSESANE